MCVTKETRSTNTIAPQHLATEPNNPWEWDYKVLGRQRPVSSRWAINIVIDKCEVGGGGYHSCPTRGFDWISPKLRVLMTIKMLPL